MTGLYVRVQRDGSWDNLEIEHLTNSERKAILSGRGEEELLRWIDALCNTIAAVPYTSRDD